MSSGPHSANRLLNDLTAADAESLKPHLRIVDLAQGDELAVAGTDLLDAYFPQSGAIISLVVRLSDGEMTEIAMVGKDSVFGASAALAGPRALTNAIVQTPGPSSVISIRWLQDAASTSQTLRAILIRHEQAIFIQAQQSVACFASHTAGARLARWLLRARDASGSEELEFTQDFLAQMIGVKRNAVSSVAIILQDKGLIRFSRGNIQLLDVPGLGTMACECYATVRDELEQLKRSHLH